jgi:hypothetical protein
MKELFNFASDKYFRKKERNTVNPYSDLAYYLDCEKA